MNILHGIRSTIIAAFFSLPLLFISFTAFLAISLGTPGLFILFLGQLLLSVTTLGFHFLENIIEIFFPLLKSQLTVNADRAALLQGSTTDGIVNVFPSYWMVHVLFFLSYLLANAVDVFRADAGSKAVDWKISNRRSKAIAVIIVIVLVITTLVAIRCFLTGTETLLGAIIALPVVAVGFGWYELAKVCGARDSDIFGIIQQMTPNGGAPTTCVYTPIA
jgi:hypothetical protein